jgi:hypothetical protein
MRHEDTLQQQFYASETHVSAAGEAASSCTRSSANCMCLQLRTHQRITGTTPQRRNTLLVFITTELGLRDYACNPRAPLLQHA